MSVLVLGAAGFLGNTIMDILGKKLYGLPLIPRDKDLDITHYEKLHHFFAQTKPKFCINTVALPNPDTCEKSPKAAYNINVLGALNVAKLSRIFKCYLIHFSTDYVFDGRESKGEWLYTETHKPNPLQVYGKTKMMCENATKDFSTIIRLSYLYGFNSNKTHAGFIFDTAQDLIKQDRLIVCDQQLRHFTYAADVANLVFKIITNPIPYGIYHFAVPRHNSKYQAAQLVKKHLALHGYQNLGNIERKNMYLDELQASTLNAQRPIHCPLSNEKLSKFIPTTFTDLSEGIYLSVQEILNHIHHSTS